MCFLTIVLLTHASMKAQDFGVKEELRMAFLYTEVVREMHNEGKIFCWIYLEGDCECSYLQET